MSLIDVDLVRRRAVCLHELGVVLEYDGQGKYADKVDAGTSSTARPAGRTNQTLRDEKAHEDDLRLDGFEVG